MTVPVSSGIERAGAVKRRGGASLRAPYGLKGKENSNHPAATEGWLPCGAPPAGYNGNNVFRYKALSFIKNADFLLSTTRKEKEYRRNS